MKKTYKNPTLTVVKIRTAHLMQASAKMYGRNATSEGMSRHTYWDDEDDE